MGMNEDELEARKGMNGERIEEYGTQVFPHPDSHFPSHHCTFLILISEDRLNGNNEARYTGKKSSINIAPM